MSRRVSSFSVFMSASRRSPSKQRRQAGPRLIEQGLLAQEFVLTPVPNAIEKLLVQERAGDHVGSLMK